MKYIAKYLQFAESLKLVRKAEIEDPNSKNIIDEIYTDLLPENGILTKVNLPKTTILVGRKGTGKSTVFQKSMNDVDKNKKIISIYIDVKTLYDNAAPLDESNTEGLISTTELTKYLIYESFLKQIILETKTNIQKKLNSNYINKILGLDLSCFDKIEK